MAIIGYPRVSTEEQVAGQSIGEQIRQIEGAAMVLGGSAEIHADEGVSGTTPFETRPAGSVVLGKLKRGDTLIVTKLDRAFRSTFDALKQAEALKAAGVSLVILQIGLEPVNQNGAGKLFFTMLAAVAEFEHSQIMDRTNSGRKAKKAAGGCVGGVPVGYTKTGVGKDAMLVADPAMQAAIGTAKEARAAGFSLRAAADLASQKHGVKLSHESIRRWERAENERTGK